MEFLSQTLDLDEFVEFEQSSVIMGHDYSSIASLDFLASTHLRVRESHFICTLTPMNLARDRGKVEDDATSNIFQLLFHWAELAYKSPSAPTIMLKMPG